MQEFTRIFKYVRPQWPRVVMVVLLVILITILFVASFATITPLLKVMMGQEGLHGWIDRKISDWRYDVGFSVPEYADVVAGDNEGIGSYLLVTGVGKDSLAAKSGLRFGRIKRAPSRKKHG